jgi:AraC-like DNA-binding protein
MSARDGFPTASPENPLIADVTAHPGPDALVIDIHDGAEVGVMLRGTAERHFQDFVLPGIPGDVWLCAMWEPHGRRVVSANSENVVLQFAPELLGEEVIAGKFWFALFAVQPRERPWVSTPEVRERVLAIGQELKSEIQEKRRAWGAAVRMHLVHLLFILSRDWDPPAEAGPQHATLAGNLSRIMPALALLRSQRGNRLRLQQAAAACGLSPSRFAVIFRQTMGVTYARFALRARLAFASQQLLTTNLTVDDIATEAGFVDASHLHRHFVKHYGRTPHSYRISTPGPGQLIDAVGVEEPT